LPAALYQIPGDRLSSVPRFTASKLGKLATYRVEDKARHKTDRCIAVPLHTLMRALIFCRTTLVFLLISQVVSVHTGITCDVMDQYHAIPLCSAKAIWDARTVADWTLERKIYDTQTKGCSLQSVGDLIGAQDAGGDSFRARALDNWNAHADGLGSLLSATIGLMCRKERRALCYQI
jgi:hypothetical protein